MYKKILSFILIIFLSINILISDTYANEYSDDYQEDTSEETTEDTSKKGDKIELVSEAAIVMNADTGQIIYEKNAHKKMYPASITKIMTALLAIESGKMDTTITMTEDAVWGIERDSTHIALDVDEQISFKDALYATMVVSANEAAWGIADHISGNLDNFCKLMNDKAAKLGCENTHFVNANGLHDENHYTTAYDMALITKAALQYDEFKEIAGATHYIIPPTNKNSESRELWQDNKLLFEESEFYYAPCLGGKTGFTDEAGGTLVTWATKDNMTLICVTMNGIPSYETYNDTIKLYDYVFSHYSKFAPFDTYEFSAEELTKAQNFLNEHYNRQNKGTMKLSIDEGTELLLPWDYDEKKSDIKIEYSTDQLEDGIIGSLTFSYEGLKYITLPLNYSGYVATTDEDAELQKVLNKYSSKKKKGLFIKLLIASLLLVGGYFILIKLKYLYELRAYQKQERREKINSIRNKNQNYTNRGNGSMSDQLDALRRERARQRKQNDDWDKHL